MSSFVLDCSVTVSWCFPDESDSYALSVRASLQQCRALAPVVWRLEFANALVTAERRHRITPADTVGYMSAVRDFGIQVEYELPEAAVDRILALARRHALSAYDAAYLELAERHGLPLATLDDRLRSAAREEGINEYQPPQ